jgi:hypothetical protein
MKHVVALLVACLLLLPVAARAQETERVVLKLDQFLKLYEKGKAEKEEEPPRDHAIASSFYRGEVLFEDGKPYAARFQATFKVRPLKKKGFARIPILPATVAIESATIEGRDAPVVIENGFYNLITERRTDFDLEVVLGAGVTTTEGRSQVTFQLVPSGSTRLELKVPSQEDLDFEVANARIRSDKVEGDARVVEATIPATGSLSIQWQRKIDEVTKKKEARVYAEAYTLASVGDGVVKATSSVQNVILFTGVESFQYEVPQGMTVLDVQGPGIREWKLDGQKLGVTLNFAAEGAYALEIKMERPLAGNAGVIPAPMVVPLGVERARGWVGVESLGNLELTAGEVRGATPVDGRMLPAAILGITDQPVLLGYKYLGAKATIGLQTAQHDEVEVLVTLLDQTQAQTMWNREGRRLTSVHYQVRNNRRQFLKLSLPKDAELWSASVAGRAVQPAKASDGRVMIPLIRSKQAGSSLAAFQVEVVYVETGTPTDARGKGTFTATLPVPDVPSTYVAWTVYSPEQTKVKKRSIDGNLNHVEYLSQPIATEDLELVEAPAQVLSGEIELADQKSGGMTRGAAPVPVSLPLQGVETYFERTLALGDQLTVKFDYKGLKKKR